MSVQGREGFDGMDRGRPDSPSLARTESDINKEQAGTEEVDGAMSFHKSPPGSVFGSGILGSSSAAPLPPNAHLSLGLQSSSSAGPRRSNSFGQGSNAMGSGGIPPIPSPSPGLQPSGSGGIGRTNSMGQGLFRTGSGMNPPILSPSPGLHNTSSGSLLRSNSGLHASGSGNLLRTTSSGTADALKTALHRTSSLKKTISRTSSANARDFVEAIARTTTGDGLEAAVKADSFWRKLQQGLVARAIARAMVCLFFMDKVLEAYQDWKFHQTPLMQQRIADYPHRYKDPGFPYFQVMAILPCALLVILGIWVPVTASVLVLDMLRDNAAIIWTGLMVTLKHKIQPDELTVKHMAMLGASTLVLANSMRDRATSNTVAGDPNRQAGRVRSLVLLLSRLTITLLFITVGISQAKRIIARDWAWLTSDVYLRRDGHDNNWLLLEALLAIPFALGWRTRFVAPLLALTCILEAFFCWPPWESWPSVQYQSHVRSHFATNLGVAGGLILLQTFGPGSYTLDQLLSKKNK